MRTTGVLDAPRGLCPGDHVCWIYEDDDELARSATAFLREGLEAGERVAFVSGEPPEAARRTLRPLGDLERLLRDGVLEVHTTAGRYSGGVADPVDQVRAYAEATDRARRDGFTGLRVAAEVTALVTEPSRRATFCEYEHLVDRYMTEHPFTAMCCYDARVLGAAAGELACLHPTTNLADMPFRCFAAADGSVRLSGEVDLAAAEAFSTALRHVAPGRLERLRVDGRDLGFIDHRGLVALAGAAEAVELHTRFHGARRLASLLGLERLDVRITA